MIDIRGVCDVLRGAPIASSTLEIIGAADILQKSVAYLRANGM